jgi:chemotaxis protein MotB
MKDNSYNNSFITYDDDSSWLITYADLMTLLLVFFVLLYSLSSLEKEKYKARVETMHSNTAQGESGFDQSVNTKISIEDITGLRSREKVLIRQINKFVRQSDQSENINFVSRDGKIIITVSGETLFSSGSADLNSGALPVFRQMIQIFEAFPEYLINIKGHTDDIPISTPAFPSNWELSAIRATTVLKHLVSMGIKPQRLTATGYGDIMPRVPNTTVENRDKNRRVEFVLEKNQTEY